MMSIHLTATCKGQPPPRQRRWLRSRLLHRPQARPGALHLHIDAAGLELREPGTAGVEDMLGPDLCARARHDGGRALRQQLPPLPAPDADVDAQRRHRRLALHQAHAG